MDSGEKSFKSSIDDMVITQLESMSISLVIPKFVNIIVSPDDGSIVKVCDNDEHSLPFALTPDEPEVGGLSIIVRKGKKGTTYRVMLRTKDGYDSLKVNEVITLVVEEEKKEDDIEDIVTVNLEVDLLDTLEMPLMGFEGTKDAHLKKHGAEFDLEDAGKYTRLAQQFGKATDKKYRIAVIGDTTIKVDSDTGWVLIAHGKRIRTFYVWDKKYSDPLTYAVYYTITHNQKTPLTKYKNLNVLASDGINLVAMQEEVIVQLLKEDNSSKTVHEVTLAPIELIEKMKEELGIE